MCFLEFSSSRAAFPVSPWLRPFPPIPNQPHRQQVASVSPCLLLSSSLPLLPSCKDACDYIWGPRREARRISLSQILNVITSANSLLTGKITYSQAAGIRIGVSLESVCLPQWSLLPLKTTKGVFNCHMHTFWCTCLIIFVYFLRYQFITYNIYLYVCIICIFIYAHNIFTCMCLCVFIFQMGFQKVGRKNLSPCLSLAYLLFLIFASYMGKKKSD